MKLLKSIVGGVCAAGLMAAATNQAQAGGFVIDNTLYVPITLSVKASAEVDGKHRTATISEKEILESLGFSSKATLVIATDTGDVWDVVTKNTPDEDLTADGFITISDTEVNSTTSRSTTTETGTVALAIYTSPQFESGVLDAQESEDDSEDWIEVSGDYTLKKTYGTEKNGVEKHTDSYSAKGLTGTVYSEGDTGMGDGTISGNGSGNIAVP